MPSKGTIDVRRRLLWIPVTTSEKIQPEDCDFFTCDPATGRMRDQYLYRLNVDQLLGAGPRVTRVHVPKELVAGAPFVVRVVSTLKAVDRRASGLVLYDA